MSTTILSINQIDTSYYARTAMDETTISEYLEILMDGGNLTPIQAVNTGSKVYVTDGHMRLEATRRAGKDKIAVDLCNGDPKDVMLRVLAANGVNGKRRTSADVRKAILLAYDNRATLFPDATDSHLATAISRTCVTTRQNVYNVLKENCQNLTKSAPTAAPTDRAPQTSATSSRNKILRSLRKIKEMLDSERMPEEAREHVNAAIKALEQPTTNPISTEAISIQHEARTASDVDSVSDPEKIKLVKDNVANIEKPFEPFNNNAPSEFEMTPDGLQQLLFHFAYR